MPIKNKKFDYDNQTYLYQKWYLESESNRHGFEGHGSLSPTCLPIPPSRHIKMVPKTGIEPVTY